MLLGVDVGGTFTDAVLYDGTRIHTAKVASTPDDQSRGVIDATLSVLEGAGSTPRDVKTFAHGMTVGTNALLEERGARTALLATEGFTDLLEIGRQNRPRLYHLCAPKPAPLAPPELSFGVSERIAPGGVVKALEAESVDEAVRAVVESGAESVAICLLFSYLEPAHEARLAGALRERLPEVHVSASHEVLAEFREYERCSTTVVDAYLSPLLDRYLSHLAQRCSEQELPEPVIMRSSGGVAPLSEAARSGAWSVLSGPAGGAVAAALLARVSGDGNAVGLDMGGTSCDVCVVENGEVRRTDSRTVGGRVLQLPMVDVHTVGAGGGSVAWRDEGGALRVGPRSAGAEPGPACYGHGGVEPTVTDANLLLGYLPADAGLAGGMPLDVEQARAAVVGLGDRLGLDELACAEGIVRVANQEMTRALRVMTVERGVDPRPFALLPFGGAGPMHAAALAGELGMDRILCPRASGVLSALGLASTERRRDAARTVLLAAEELTRERIAAEVEALRASIAAGIEEAELTVRYELRYRGQAFELPVAGSPEPEPAELSERFATEHERRYGYRDPGAPVDLVTIRIALTIPGPRLEPAAAGGGEITESRRNARFDGEWTAAAVVRGEPVAGYEARGPCIFELPEATLVLPPGWGARVDAGGTIDARRA